MKGANEKLLEAIGNVEERYIQEYVNTKRAQPKHSRRSVRLIALVAAVIMLIGTVSAVSWTNAEIGWEKQLSDGIESLSKNFQGLGDTYRIPVNQKQMIVIPNGEYDRETDTVRDECLTLEVYEVVVERHHLLVACHYSYTDSEQKDDFVNPHSYAWNLTLSQEGKVVYIRNDENQLRTSSYTLEDGTDALMYDIELGDFDGKKLLGKETVLNFYYGKPGEGFFFTFTPEQCYEEMNYFINRSFDVEDPHGRTHHVTFKSVQDDALYLDFDIEDDGFTEQGYYDWDANFEFYYEYQVVGGNGVAQTIDGHTAKPRDVEDGVVVQLIKRPAYNGEQEVVFEFSVPLKKTLFQRIYHAMFGKQKSDQGDMEDGSEERMEFVSAEEQAEWERTHAVEDDDGGIQNVTPDSPFASPVK